MTTMPHQFFRPFVGKPTIHQPRHGAAVLEFQIEANGKQFMAKCSNPRGPFTNPPPPTEIAADIPGQWDALRIRQMRNGPIVRYGLDFLSDRRDDYTFSGDALKIE